ncbi:MAG: DUF503 domain-containing protein [Actinobacteria bacterium]|nr:DUF503 domain-containing protein [Actinomycetota bacterium]
MFIGIARFELFMPEARSLKDKRQVLRSLVMTVRKKFPVAVAEVEFQDLWQRAAVGISCVAESSGHCRSVLEEVERTIGKTVIGGAEITARRFEYVALEDL